MPIDEIIGYITRGRGAAIRQKRLPKYFRVKERKVDQRGLGHRKTYPITVQVKAYARQGLSDISTVITNKGHQAFGLK